MESVSPACTVTEAGAGLAWCVSEREGSTRVVPGASRVGSGKLGLAAMSSSQRVPRPRCRRDSAQSVSPERTTTAFTGLAATAGAVPNAERFEGISRLGAAKSGFTDARGSCGRMATAGGIGCWRRENGSTRCGGTGRSEGEETTGALFAGTEGFMSRKSFAGGCGRGCGFGFNAGSGASIFGAASSG